MTEDEFRESIDEIVNAAFENSHILFFDMTEATDEKLEVLLEQANEVIRKGIRVIALEAQN